MGDHLALNLKKNTLGFDSKGTREWFDGVRTTMVQTAARGFPLITSASRSDQPGPVEES